MVRRLGTISSRIRLRYSPMVRSFCSAASLILRRSSGLTSKVMRERFLALSVCWTFASISSLRSAIVLPHFPHLDRLIPRARCNACAIRRPRYAADPIRVAGVGGNGAAREGVPDLHGFVEAAGGDIGG